MIKLNFDTARRFGARYPRSLDRFRSQRGKIDFFFSLGVLQILTLTYIVFYFFPRKKYLEGIDLGFYVWIYLEYAFLQTVEISNCLGIHCEICCFLQPKAVFPANVAYLCDSSCIWLTWLLRTFWFQEWPLPQETRIWSLGQEDPLGKGMASHSSILAFRISWTEEPGGLQSVGSQRVRHDWVTNTIEYLILVICNFSIPILFLIACN